MPGFNAADHLVKQGWQGKGTALRNGHATRPLAVVQKKSMSGIGKDRDEAVPFWDHIFASTAASLVSSSTSPNGSPAPPPQPVVSIAARTGQDFARRGLYSRFSRGTTISKEASPEAVAADVASGWPSSAEAGPSRITLHAPGGIQHLTDAKLRARKREKRTDGESKEDRRARRAERAQRKAAKIERREAKAQKRAERAARKARRVAGAGKTKKRTREKEQDAVDGVIEGT